MAFAPASGGKLGCHGCLGPEFRDSCSPVTLLPFLPSWEAGPPRVRAAARAKAAPQATALRKMRPWPMRPWARVPETSRVAECGTEGRFGGYLLKGGRVVSKGPRWRCKGLVSECSVQAMCRGSGPSGRCAKGAYGLRKWSLKILSLEWRDTRCEA